MDDEMMKKLVFRLIGLSVIGIILLSACVQEKSSIVEKRSCVFPVTINGFEKSDVTQSNLMEELVKASISEKKPELIETLQDLKFIKAIYNDKRTGIGLLVNFMIFSDEENAKRFYGQYQEDEVTSKCSVANLEGFCESSVSFIWLDGNIIKSVQSFRSLTKEELESFVNEFKDCYPELTEIKKEVLPKSGKIIDTELSPEKVSAYAKYTTQANTKKVTFLMTALPGTYINLHIYDENRNHVGYSPICDCDEVEILNANYTGSDSGPERITIHNPGKQEFEVIIKANRFTTASPESVEVLLFEKFQ